MGASNTGGNGIAFDPSRSGTTAHVKNNIIINCYIALYDTSAAATWDSNNNLFYNCGSVGRTTSFWTSLTNWISASGDDGSSLLTNPLLTATYSLTTSSPAIAKGVNLYSYFTEDKNGSPRPQTGAWDIGAFASNTGSSVVAPTNASISISTN
jgi:hypothetical protein